MVELAVFVLCVVQVLSLMADRQQQKINALQYEFNNKVLRAMGVAEVPNEE